MVVVNLGSRYTVLFNRRETFFDVAHITPGRLLLLNGTLTAFDFRFLNIGNSTWKAFLTYHVSFGMIIQIEDVKEGEGAGAITSQLEFRILNPWACLQLLRGMQLILSV